VEIDLEMKRRAIEKVATIPGDKPGRNVPDEALITWLESL
jgi:hypothetical protein